MRRTDKLNSLSYVTVESVPIPSRSGDSIKPPRAMDASLSLRKIRNREAAARSNQKRKENLEILVRDLAEAKSKLQSVKEKEERVRQENKQLHQELQRMRRGG